MLDPLVGFPPETFRARRRRIMETLEASGDALGDAMLLPAAPVRYASRDTEYPYRPDSELFYLTGVAEPDAVAVLRGHCERSETAPDHGFILFVRARDEKAELWTGPRLDPAEAGERFGADATYPLDELEGRLPDLLRGAGRLHYRLGGPERVEVLVRRTLETARARGQRKGEGPRAVVDPGEILDDMRLVKDRVEMERIRRAVSVTVEGHRAAMALARPGVGEREIQARLESVFRGRGGDGPAFGTIVASGANACILHYVENRDELSSGDLVLVDAGASVGLYAGDVTRTFPADGRFTPEQRAVYDIVDGARAAAIATVRPGATVDEVHRACVEVLVTGLVELGILEGTPSELAAGKAHEPFFPHQTSHWLGLDVHDPGDYARYGASRRLEPGMVLTVEPGLYLSPEGPAGDGPYAGVGIRIEDDVAVTEEGCEVLTSELPTDPGEVERMVGG